MTGSKTRREKPGRPLDFDGVLLEVGDPVIATMLYSSKQEKGRVVSLCSPPSACCIVVEVESDGKKWRSSASLWKKAPK